MAIYRKFESEQQRGKVLPSLPFIQKLTSGKIGYQKCGNSSGGKQKQPVHLKKVSGRVERLHHVLVKVCRSVFLQSTNTLLKVLEGQRRQASPNTFLETIDHIRATLQGSKGPIDPQSAV